MLMNYTSDKLLDMNMRMGVCYDVFVDMEDGKQYLYNLLPVYTESNMSLQHDRKTGYFEVHYELPKLLN